MPRRHFTAGSLLQQISSNCIFIVRLCVVVMPHLCLEMTWNSLHTRIVKSCKPMRCAEWRHVTLWANEMRWLKTRDTASQWDVLIGGAWRWGPMRALEFGHVTRLRALRSKEWGQWVGQVVKLNSWHEIRFNLLIKLSFWCSCFRHICSTSCF